MYLVSFNISNDSVLGLPDRPVSIICPCKFHLFACASWYVASHMPTLNSSIYSAGRMPELILILDVVLDPIK